MGEVCPSGLVLPRSPSKLREGRREENEIRERSLRVTGSRHVEVYRTKCTTRQPLPRRSLRALRSPNRKPSLSLAFVSHSPLHFLSGIYLSFWVDTRLGWSATSTSRRGTGPGQQPFAGHEPQKGQAPSAVRRCVQLPVNACRRTAASTDQALPLAVYLARMIAHRAFSLRYFVNPQGRSPALVVSPPSYSEIAVPNGVEPGDPFRDR